MKINSTLVIWFCVLSGGLKAQNPWIGRHGTDRDYKRLFFLNLQYTQSWLRSDTATYNSLLWADDFVHQSGSSGLLFPKKAISKVFGEPRIKTIEYFYPDDVRIYFVDPDAAMVIARPLYKAITSALEEYSIYNDVYVKRNGQWTCVSANITNSRTPTEATKLVCHMIPDSIPLVSAYRATAAEREAVKLIHRQVWEAESKGDTNLLHKWISDDFFLIHQTGSLLVKPDYFQFIQPVDLKKGYTERNFQIRFPKKDLAMVQYARISATNPMTGIQINEIYSKQTGRWLCATIHQTPIQN
jgi:hypothetical protein